MLAALTILDIKPLMVVLILGNITSIVLILSYSRRNYHSHDPHNISYYLPAKIAQAIAYILLISGDNVPNIVSVNMGNTLLLLGFYLEAIVMLTIIRERDITKNFIFGIFIVCIIAFNLIELIKPNSSIRIAVSSLCVFLILVVPNIRLFISKNSSPFKRWVGVFYLAFLLLLLPRAFYAFVTDMNVLTNSPIQTLTFLALVLLLIFSLPAYLLLMKENADKIIIAMANTDYLTGLSNRHSFFEMAQRSFHRLQFNGENVAFLFLDIDHFKNINDTYGHSFGDTVLETLGKIMRDCVRPSDFICRYGGEEFVVMIPGATGFVAVRVAERIQRVIKMAKFPDLPNFFYRVSVGITAGIPKQMDSLESFISRADSALYMAKKSGRNQIVEYESMSAFSDVTLERSSGFVGK